MRAGPLLEPAGLLLDLTIKQKAQNKTTQDICGEMFSLPIESDGASEYLSGGMG